VESTKELGSSPKLVNGVLDALKKSLVEKPALLDATDKSKIMIALDDAAKDGADTANKAAANIALCFISETPFTHYTEKLRNGGLNRQPRQ